MSRGDSFRRCWADPEWRAAHTARLRKQRGLSDIARADDMCDRYQNGETLQSIGDSYGITRERVRQIVGKHKGLTGRDGGEHVVALKRAEAKQREKAKKREALKQRHLEFISRVVHGRLSGLGWTEIALSVGWQNSGKGTSLPGWIRRLLIRYEMQDVISQIYVRDGAFCLAQSRAQKQRHARARAA